MSSHENDLPDPVAVRAFTIMSGFCSLVCQDRFMVSLLVTADRRIGEPHRMPVTSSQEVWEKPPFCQPFFHNDRCASERRRSWIFQHDEIPVEFPLMPTYFQWTPEAYHLLRINDEDVFRRHLTLKYQSVGHDHDGDPCDCDHDLNRDVCSAYELFEYKFVSLEQSSTLFCLSSDLGDSYRRNTLERLETVKNVFDGKEQYTFSPERQKMVFEDEERQCMGREGHGFTAGLGNQWSFNPLEFKWTLYDELFRLTSEAQLKFDFTKNFKVALEEGWKFYGKKVYDLTWTDSQVVPLPPYETVLVPAIVCVQSPIPLSNKIGSTSVQGGKEIAEIVPPYKTVHVPSIVCVQSPIRPSNKIGSTFVQRGKEIAEIVPPYKTFHVPSIVCVQSPIPPSNKIGSTSVQRGLCLEVEDGKCDQEGVRFFQLRH